MSAAAYLRVLAELAPSLAPAPDNEAERQDAAVEPVALPRSANVADRPSETAERASSLGLAGSPATA